MSRRTARTVVRNTLISLAVMALVPAASYGATDPGGPPDPNRTLVKEPAMPQTPAAPRQNPPVRPVVRTPAAFTPQMPLSEAITILRNCTTTPLNLVVLWRDLENAGIYRDTPIGIDGLPGLRIRQYLDLLVLSLSAGASDKVGYAVHRGVITIATTSSLPAPRHIARVYDVSDLVAPPSTGFGAMGYGGLYGNQMIGPAGSYGGGLGLGYGPGSSYLPGGGRSGAGGLSGLVGNSYGGTQVRSGVPRRR